MEHDWTWKSLLVYNKQKYLSVQQNVSVQEEYISTLKVHNYKNKYLKMRMFPTTNDYILPALYPFCFHPPLSPICVSLYPPP